MKIKSVLLFVAIICCTNNYVFGNELDQEDPFDLPRVVAVENKKFNPQKDITVQLGILPLDAFYKALTLGGSYTHRINSYLAWELLNLNVASSQDTNLKKDLIENFSAKQKGILDTVRNYATTQIVYTPIYSKNLLFNKDVLYGEWSFVGGGGVVEFESRETAPLFGVGLIGRFFSTEKISYKVDSRLYYHSAPNKSSDLLLMINLGVSIELDGRAQSKRSL